MGISERHTKREFTTAKSKLTCKTPHSFDKIQAIDVDRICCNKENVRRRNDLAVLWGIFSVSKLAILL